MNKCKLCDANSATYKCPKCRVLYCSVTCYKCHREQGCEEITPNIVLEQNANYTNVTEDTIPVTRLALLSSNNELRSIISNQHIRNILHEIDNSANVSEIMDKAMKEPSFLEFADTCLNIIEAKEEHGVQ